MINKKYKEIILEETVKGIFSIIIFFIPFVWAGIQSILTKTSFIGLITKIPYYIYIISILISFILFIRMKMSEGKTNSFNFYDIYPYTQINTYNKYGMNWKIEVPKNEKNYNINDIRINPKPTCQKCGVEMTHKDNLLWYTFSCFNCGQKIRTWMSIEKIRFQLKESFKINFQNKF